jgi:signal transduction histidine kinase
LVSEDKPLVRDALSKAIAEDGAYEMEYRIIHKNGSIKQFLERGRVRKSIKGEAHFIDCVILDITERKTSEIKLEQAYLKLVERQNFIESILANIQSGIIVTDLDFRIMLINSSAEKFLGVLSEDVTGKDLGIVCPTFANTLKRDEGLDEVYCTACAREHVIGFKMFDMKGKDDAVNGHIVSFADLTEIIKIRKEMKLKERLATMGEFVARVAHEIRNPLFGMTAICQIFSMELRLNDEHKKLMDSMMKEAWRLKHIVEELLDCSRELKIVRKNCDLGKIVNDSLFENEILMVEKNVSVDKHFLTDGFAVCADQEKIKQVIINLLKNAVDASNKHGIITIAIEKIENAIKFSISDSGKGIAENAMDKIFDVFYTTKRHGTGLGLAISKNIIVAHGGTLQAENRVEGGATFAFTLPISN